AGDDGARPVAVDLHVGAGGDAERRPPADGDTDRLVLGQVLAVADQLDRPLQRIRGTDVLEHLPGGTLVAVLDDVAAAELDRVHAQLPGHRGQVLLARPARLPRGGGAPG